MEKKSTIHHQTFEEDAANLAPDLRDLAVKALSLIKGANPRWREHGMKTEFNRDLEQLIDDTVEAME